jgi:hypothetical protein
VYPFKTGEPNIINWVPKMRIVRARPLTEVFKCNASRAFVVEPIPTVVRVTGMQSSHPAYGFYVALSSFGTLNNALVYSKASLIRNSDFKKEPQPF